MRFFRPRSIVSLILVSFGVVLAPFLAAVVTAVVQVDRLAQQSQSAVIAASTATEQSRALVEQLTDMQRALGQFAVRRDPDFFDIYLERRARFRNVLLALASLKLEGLDRDELRGIASREEQLFADLGGGSAVSSARVASADAIETLAALTQRARAVLAASDRLVAEQANAAIAGAETVQRTLLALTAAAAPATLILVAVFTALITRPMRALGGVIQRLGSGSLAETITVEGPRDVEVLGEQLDWLRRRIQALEEQKANFLRHISHELKTPLTTIREGSELLIESLGDAEPEDAEVARLMRTNSLHLQQLIEDLLEFARTRDFDDDLDLRDGVDLAGLVRETVAAQSVAAESKELTVEQSLERVTLRGDCDKLRVVIDNLLSNAIKYTPAGGRVSVSVRMRDGFAIIDVRDDGPGVDPAEAAAIFEPFRQGQAKYQSSVKGTGLGLAIVKEHVEAHDGYVEVVESEVGAHFRVGLPVVGPKTAARV